MGDEQHLISTAIGRVVMNVYPDGNIWISHPITGVRVGIGQLENDERQPFVCVNTEDSIEPEVDGEPVIAIDLNGADLYDVERSGPTENSEHHQPRPTPASTPAQLRQERGLEA